MIRKFYSNRIALFFLPLFFLTLSFSTALYSQPILSLTPVIDTGLNQPIQLVHAGDGSGRVFIVQKEGIIRVYDSAFNFLSNFAAITGITTAGERGLLSMAFHPAYNTNGFFYVYYTNANGDLEVARYQVSADANVADTSSKVIVITIPHPTNSNHNGGELHFGADGLLYLSTGDGGGGGDVPNNAQNTSVLLGKMLRFNVNTSATAPFYTIPAGNPFGNEIYALGLRNPYRWSFDRLTNDMWIGDVGQDSFEEINYRAADSTAGVNYGWRCYEGDNTFNTAGCAAASNYVFPAFNYPSQNPAAAITGGIVYRGPGSPALSGYYVAADFYSGIFYIINPDGSGGFTTNVQTLSPTGIVDFGETENGEAYVVSLTNGAVYRLVAVEGAPVPVTLASFRGSISNGQPLLQWNTSFEQALQQFDIEYSVSGAAFTYAGTVQAKRIATGAAYTFTHAVSVSGPVYYRLKMLDEGGRYRYSGTVRLTLNAKGAVVSPSVITDGIININLGDAGYSQVEVVNAAGIPVLRRKIEGQTGRISISTYNLAAGIYVVRFIRDTETATQKIMIK